MINGEPGTGLSVPSKRTKNTDTVSPMMELATASRSPGGLNATEEGYGPPLPNGEPVTSSRAENADMVLSPLLATASSSSRANATERGWAPTGSGEPDT